MDDREARAGVAAVEAALERLEALPESAREAADEAIAGILELYGEALRRFLAEAERREECSALVRFARLDELISHLLLLHGLHPDGEEPLRKLLLAEVPAAAAPARHPSAAEPELVTLGTGRRAAFGGHP